MKITRLFNFAAAETKFNVLAGTNLQYAPFSGTIKIGASLSASAGTINAFAGSDQFIDQAVIGVTNRVPLLPDDFLVLDEISIAEGAQIKIDLTTVGAAGIFLTVELTEL